MITPIFFNNTPWLIAALIAAVGIAAGIGLLTWCLDQASEAHQAQFCRESWRCKNFHANDCARRGCDYLEACQADCDGKPLPIEI